MSLNPDLLKSLCCPETHQPLLEAEAAFVAELNQRIAAGRIKTRVGKVAEVPLEGVLVRSDQRVAYPIRQGLPLLLIDQGILLTEGG